MSGEIVSGRELSLERDLVIDADVVVVGSGAGGAVVAAELAEAGQRVVVLEEGQHLPVEAYSRMRPSEQMRRVWRDGAMTVAFGVGDSPTINVTMGKGVGGSSCLTGGVCFRTPDYVLDKWVKTRGLSELTPAKLEPFFDEVERAIHVEEVPLSMRSRGTELFAEGAARVGIDVKPMRRNTRGCNGCGRCNFGCPHGAKLGVDLTYLPRAVAAGARIYSDCLVDDLVIVGDRAVGVRGRVLTRHAPRRWLLGTRRYPRFEVRARRVVVAAGSYHTPLLLARAGVGRASGQVGRNMTLHPGFRVFARFDEPVLGWRGALQSAYSTSLEHERITLTGLFVPAGVLAATAPGVGPAHAAAAREVPHLCVFGGLIHDEGGGVVRAGPGREPIATYRMAPEDRAAIPKLIRAMADAFFAAGAREVLPPILGQSGVDADAFERLDLDHIPAMKLEASSQHPMGTARMGSTREHSVVDSSGQAWDVRDLYVADGSIVPTSLGVNPQESIMAMALRVAWIMRDRPLPA